MTSLLGVSILLAAAASGLPTAVIEMHSTRPSAQFSSCFAAAQDRNGRAWAYLPTAHGGAFTDSGAYGAAASYWLLVRTAGTSTHLRLSDAAPSRVLKAVEQCR